MNAILLSRPLNLNSSNQVTFINTNTCDEILSYGPGHAKMCLMPYANNKGADQPAHPRSLITTFVVRCLDSIIPLDFIYIISRLAGLCSGAGQF